MKKHNSRSLLILLLIGVSLIAEFSDSWALDINYLGSTLWGGINGVQVEGNYAYCAINNGLVILDISQPSSPALIGRLYVRPRSHNGNHNPCGENIAVSGSYAYLCFGADGLKVIDISNPVNPILIGGCETPSPIMSAVVDGNYAYLCGGLYIVDIANPAQPRIVFSDSTTGISQISIQGHYAYAAGLLGFNIIDIADPAHPATVGSYFKNHAMGVAAQGAYAYVNFHDTSLYVFYVGNPQNPTLVENYRLPDRYWTSPVVAQGDYAYLRSEHELHIINISNPSNLNLAASIELTVGVARNFWVTDNYVYVAIPDNLLDIVDISNPSQPLIAGNYFATSWIVNVQPWGQYAFVTDYSRGFSVVGTADPYNPEVLASFDTLGPTMEAYPLGNYLYVASMNNGFKVFDISDINHINLIGSCPTVHQACDISIVGQYAYVADYGGGLQVINISDPANPAIVGSYPSNGALAVVVKDTLAYVTDFYDGFLILNISDPESPALLGSVSTEDHAANLKVVGDYAYVVGVWSSWDHPGKFSIIDISNPTEPDMVGSIGFDNFDTYEDVEIYHDWAFLAYWEQGLRVVDITDRTNPVLIGEYATSGKPCGVAVANGLVYLADMSSLMIFSFDAESNPPCAGYVVGDINGSGRFDGLDIVYGVNYFKGGPPPLYRCECTSGNSWFVAGDLNASCSFNGLDVTYGVSYLKGGPSPSPCPDCPPQ